MLLFVYKYKANLNHIVHHDDTAVHEGGADSRDLEEIISVHLAVARLNLSLLDFDDRASGKVVETVSINANFLEDTHREILFEILLN